MMLHLCHAICTIHSISLQAANYRRKRGTRTAQTPETQRQWGDNTNKVYVLEGRVGGKSGKSSNNARFFGGNFHDNACNPRPHTESRLTVRVPGTKGPGDPVGARQDKTSLESLQILLSDIWLSFRRPLVTLDVSNCLRFESRIASESNRAIFAES